MSGAATPGGSAVPDAARTVPPAPRPTERCYAVLGTAMSGPMYCGNRAKSKDENGRPICGVHRRGNPGISWFGKRARYPEGTAGDWKFVRGEFR